MPGNVRFGSLADIQLCLGDFRFMPESGHPDIADQRSVLIKPQPRNYGLETGLKDRMVKVQITPVASPRNQSSGRSPQLPSGTFLSKSYPGFEPTKPLSHLPAPSSEGPCFRSQNSLFHPKNSLFECAGKSALFRLIHKGKPVSSTAQNRISLYFPVDQGIGRPESLSAWTASTATLVVGFQGLSRPSRHTPEEARNCATDWQSFFLN